MSTTQKGSVMSYSNQAPWYVDGHTIKITKPDRAFLGDGAPETICEMLSSVSPEETSGNQRLISAAPELLTALQVALAKLSQFVPKDAKGWSTACFKYVAGGDIFDCDCAICTARAAIAKATGNNS